MSPRFIEAVAAEAERLVVPEPAGLRIVTWLSAIVWLPLILLATFAADESVRNRMSSDWVGVAAFVGFPAMGILGAVASFFVWKRRRWAHAVLLMLYGIWGLLGTVNFFVALLLMGLSFADRRLLGNAAILAVSAGFSTFYQSRKMKYYLEGVTRPDLRADLGLATEGPAPNAEAARWALSTMNDEYAVQYSARPGRELTRERAMAVPRAVALCWR